MSSPRAPETRADAGLAADQAFAAALLPVLLHRIRNTTQLLTGVNAVLAGGEPGVLPATRAEDLGQASREAEELGWLLAVLSGGLGCDLAGERREADGLRVVLSLVRDALRRAGGALALPTRWPRIAGGAPAAQLCLAVGELVWRAARGAEGAALELEPLAGEARLSSAWRLRLRSRRGEPSTEPAARAPQASAAGEQEAALHGLPSGARLERAPDGFSLELPPGWLVRAS